MPRSSDNRYAAPAVSDIFKSWTDISSSLYKPNVPSDPESDEDDEISLPLRESWNIVSGKTNIDVLCQTCSKIDFRLIFQHGVQYSPPERVGSNDAKAVLSGIDLGLLDQIAKRDICPFCRLVSRLGKEKFPCLFTTDHWMRDLLAPITCFLQTISSDDLPDFVAPGSGPPALYIDIELRLKDGHKLNPTCQRYLILDGADASAVDSEWVDTRKPGELVYEGSGGDESGEEEDEEDEEDQPKPDGLPKKYFYSGRKVPQGRVDFELLKGWITHCESVHRGNCNSELLGANRPFSLMVIDILKRVVVPAPSGCRYVALSYVWGAKKEGDESTYSLRSGKLPQTIEDAITVVYELGERYLWVDAICIRQDDPNDKHNQIRNMDSVYGGALLTIVAAAGTNSEAGLPGVKPGSRWQDQYSEIVNGLTIYVSLPLLREALESSVKAGGENSSASETSEAKGWITRGWTMQEALLSRKCFIFTPSQVFWKCCEELCCESMTEALDHQRASANRPIHDEIFCSPRLERNFKTKTNNVRMGTGGHYFDLVHAFTQRNLTFDSDRLNAFRGVINAMQKAFGSKYCWGLPEDIFDFALLWVPTSLQSSKMRHQQFPSWAWASWPGCVDYYVSNRLSGKKSKQPMSVLDTAASIRKETRYWKFDKRGKAKRIIQKHTRYPPEVEKAYDLVKEDGSVKYYMYQRADYKEWYLWQLKEFMPIDIPNLDSSMLADLPSMDSKCRTILLLFTSTFTLRIVPIESESKAYGCRCRIIHEDSESTTANDLDECIFVDDARYLPLLKGRKCDFITLSSCYSESLDVCVWNVMLVLKLKGGIGKRLGIGYVRLETLQRAKPVGKPFFLR